MKHPVTRFKNLKVALKELEPFVRDGEHLETGRPFARFGGMRSREALANWLLCVAVNSDCGSERMTFTSDPTGGDGVIYDTLTGADWPTEHVIVTRPRSPNKSAPVDTQSRILKAISDKQGKGGAAYASGKQLVVFLNTVGITWHPNRVARNLPDPLLFNDVWVVGLQIVDNGNYIYAVTRLDVAGGDAPVFEVRIESNFESWTVHRIQ